MHPEASSNLRVNGAYNCMVVYGVWVESRRYRVWGGE